ncbi:hypothetical protein [Kitasatospora sp. NPDC088351]|uniref:hypothetical protein n=1 Tax=unclassified Kitasatospora TaxID=2633591 RepID=UPI003442F381
MRETATRQRLLEHLGEQLAWWGAPVPEDPGTGELAELAHELAAWRARHNDERMQAAAVLLESAAHRLDACARLFGAAHVLQHWHLSHARRDLGRAQACLQQPSALPSSG